MHVTKKLRKAVLPVAGLGTRFLPATKAMAKEMLPVVDKPLIQYAVEEARAAGIEQFCLVTGRGKTALIDHFDVAYELESTLRERGKNDLIGMLDGMKVPPGSITTVRQQVPMGLGHAIWCARAFIGDDPFAILLPDDLVLSETPCLKQLADCYYETGGNVVAVAEVPREQTNRYGILRVGSDDGRAVEVTGLVEKPKPEDAPSNLSIIGRYVLMPEVLGFLSQMERGAGNEVQLTDAMAKMIGHMPFHGLRYEGRRFDCGDKIGFLEAQIAFALKRPELAAEVQEFLKRYTGSCLTMAFKHQFDATSLREYDIRGVVGRTLHAADAFAIGRSFGSVVARAGGHTVAVGYDGRLSSPELAGALVDGLKASGMEVLRVGRGPTPMLYFAATTLETDGAVMVTGSHNPPDYNGFKMMLGRKAFFGADIQMLGRIAAAGDVVPEAQGNDHAVDVAEDYIARLLKDWDGGDRQLRVVWDNANGAAGEVLERLVKVLPGHHTVLNPVIDGRFPAHHPDPTIARNQEQLIAAVREQGADLGIGFDGDADRIGVVDDGGGMLFGDQLMVVLARDVLRTHPGATIIADVKASQVLYDEIARAGGKPLMFKTGHSLIKARMAEIQAPFAGEMSGHIFYADRWYGFDDALYVAVRLLGIVARMPGKLSEVRLALPQVVNTPELRFDCDDTRKFAVVQEVAARLRAAHADLNDIDGVRVLTPDGWWLLRASNTQAVLVARAEARDEAGLERLKAALVEQLLASGLDAPDFSGENAGH